MRSPPRRTGCKVSSRSALRIAQVQRTFPLVAEIQLVSPADRADLVGTVQVLVVHQAVRTAHRGAVDDGIAVDIVGTDVGEGRPAGPQTDVTHPVVPHAVLIELRVVEIDSAEKRSFGLNCTTAIAPSRTCLLEVTLASKPCWNTAQSLPKKQSPLLPSTAGTPVAPEPHWPL